MCREQGISDVTVSASNNHSAVTDLNGLYTITGLITGTYTITPTLNGYSFNPSSRTVTVPPDATGQDFVGQRATMPWTLMYYQAADSLAGEDDPGTRMYLTVFQQTQHLRAGSANPNVNIVIFRDTLSQGGVYEAYVGGQLVGGLSLSEPNTGDSETCRILSMGEERFPRGSLRLGYCRSRPRADRNFSGLDRSGLAQSSGVSTSSSYIGSLRCDLYGGLPGSESGKRVSGAGANTLLRRE